jgi:hypothetical protein
MLPVVRPPGRPPRLHGRSRRRSSTARAILT